ncbi:MAG: glutamate synthase subunit beta [Campylobacteraceae bacterium]|jgi:glutamate synthase (NADPH/NADH) small chain|nr:glutamate synthase subunit beta [Campylobacteraceae bacterium]
MQDFLTVERAEIKKRSVTERIKDFKEIYELLSKDDIQEQASRCIQCGDPFCHNKCPLHNFIPFWLKAIGARADMRTAFALSNESNPFPEITGRVCPQERLCEGDCSLNDGYGAITIGAVETAISENGFRNGLKPLFATKKINKSVAIVGSGPASISAATYLLRAGVKVVMYEKQNRAGGLLTYGIPGFKIEKEIIARRVNWLIEAGLELKTNTEVGKDISFSELVNSHDAIFLGLGAELPNRANISNENANGTIMAVDFLRNIQKKQFKEELDADIAVADKNVVVIGGGDTAMDCLRSSIRENAKSVTCLYRRDKFNMPGSKKEFKNALDEGVNFVYNAAPKDIIVNSEGKVIGLNMQKTIMSDKDALGRQSIEIVKGSDFKIDADIVIFALGFTPNIPTFLAENGIDINNRGAIATDSRYHTSKAGIYAGGDCMRGSALVVTAAADGKMAAMQILKDLSL